MSRFVQSSTVRLTPKGTVVLIFFKDGEKVFEKEYYTLKGAMIARTKLSKKYLGFYLK